MRRIRTLATRLVAALLLAAPAGLSAQSYDIVIRNGRVLDGMGNPWIRADIAIKGGKIAAIGLITAKGAREIDAAGKYVTPGWIDMMDQSGSVLLRNGLAENKVLQGVTTAIGGEGGFPVSASEIPKYFQTLETQGISINFGSYYSQTQARTPVLGGSTRRAPTAAEMIRIRASIDSAMRAGAMGMTTALIYPPSSYTTTPELIESAKALAPYGGTYASHIRGEGAELLEAIGEAIEIGEKAGVPVEIFHLKAAYQPGWGTLMQGAYELIEAARARGVDVAADQYPYTAGGTGLEATIPSWAFEGGRDSLRARLTNPQIRARLKNELKTGSPGWWNIIEAAGSWDGVVLTAARSQEYEKYQGKSISAIAKELGKDPADVAWDMVLAGQGRVMAVYHMMSEEDVKTALRFPWVSIGSDAGASLSLGATEAAGLAHPRGYGTHPRIIAKYVRDDKVLTLPDAIRKMTSWPATRMKLPNRGSLVVGNWADVVIFDYDKIQDMATWEEPTRLPTGIDYVLVNGQIAAEGGKHTGVRSGMVLYGPGKAP
ncbi:MAG: D-aminoacylase [Gemmatimonadales bacterium]|nr:D-aminoacylase [Gemmatimonadales bacterium]